jgi:AraC family transcriptional regulator
LAAISCLSKFHFLRLFKLAYGQTPHQFILSLRVERAKKMLKKTSDEVKVIADSLGFENSATFSRTFLRHAGVSPTQYRNLI